MNLIIDQGNTSVKVAVYDRSIIVFLCSYANLRIENIFKLLKTYKVRNVLFSTVVEKDVAFIDFLKSRVDNFLYFDETVKLPIKVCYKTPETLGKDRLAAVVGAYYLSPGKNILVIDAGTAITYEVLDASGIYLGGNISPGLTTRFRALHCFTKKLPLVKESDDVPIWGTSTKTAIQAGVINGVVYEMDGCIEALKVKFPDLLVFLTGGHSFYFERRLKNSIFADINLVLTGLNRILEYNVED